LKPGIKQQLLALVASLRGRERHPAIPQLWIGDDQISGQMSNEFLPHFAFLTICNSLLCMEIAPSPLRARM
jgi:hypothetical protein